MIIREKVPVHFCWCLRSCPSKACSKAGMKCKRC